MTYFSCRKLSKTKAYRLESWRGSNWQQKLILWKRITFHWHTIRRAMQDLKYHKCLIYTKFWIVLNLRLKRRTFARDRFDWSLSDWQRIRFSDEVHFELESWRKLRIIRRSDERYCHDCIQVEKESQLKDVKRSHAWAYVEWDFKSNLMFYEMSGNSNDKMSQKVYINFILESIMKSTLERKKRFILKEDDDSEHNSADNNNIVWRWKKDLDLEYYFNALKSSDLFIIENCWQLVKQYLSNSNHWDDEITLNAIKRDEKNMCRRIECWMLRGKWLVISCRIKGLNKWIFEEVKFRCSLFLIHTWWIKPLLTKLSYIW